MATIQELLDLAYQIRDAEQNGENTALRVGQFLVELVNHFNTKADVDNISGAYHLKQQQAPIMALMSVQQMSDSNGQDNKAWWSTDGHIKYQHNGRIYDLGTPAYMLYYCGDKIYKWTGSATGFKLMTDGGGGSSGGGASVFANFAVAASTNELPDNGVATTGYIVGQNIYAYVGVGGDTKGGKYQNLGELNAAGVSLTTNGDGTFTVHAGGNDYTVNLNHSHPNMAKLIVCEESDLPSTLDMDTIYAQVNDASNPTEIEVLYIAGLEFAGGGGGTPGLPAMQSPGDGSTIQLGENQGSGVSQNIIVRAKNLNYGDSTDGLTIEAVGTGLTLSYGQQTGQSSITIPQTNGAVNTEVGVAFSGSGSFNGELRFKQGSTVLAVVVVVVVVVVLPVGFISDKAWNQSGNTISIVDASGYCVSKQYEVDYNHTFEVNFGFANSGGTQYGCAVSVNSNMLSSGSAGTCFWANSAVRTFKPNNSEKYLSCTFLKSELNNCYIKDTNTNTYIWKGNNVT